MTTLDAILYILKEKKLSQKELCESLNLNKTAVTNWKKGNNNSYMKHLPKIAEFLGVNVNTLLYPNVNIMIEENNVIIADSNPNDSLVKVTLNRYDFEKLLIPYQCLSEEKKQEVIKYIKF